ncbi:MAG: hypothetical protein ACUVRK_08195 [Spirochaetota bacterium]
MIVLYAAVVVIITGVLVILYAEFFEISIKKTIPHERFVPNFDDNFTETKPGISKKRFVEENGGIDISDLPDIDIDLNDEIASGTKNEQPIKNKGKESIGQLHDIKKDYEVVLYIDSSGTIGSVLDHLSSRDWSFMTRVGSGFLQYVQLGINITINNKLYRYDFYRIASMKANDNYMLFTMKGKNAVNCIVLNEKSDILLNIEKEYHNFKNS